MTFGVRPIKRKIFFSLVSILLFGLSACAPEQNRGSGTEQILIFGTEAQLDLRAADEDTKSEAMAGIIRAWTDQHLRWHAWEPSQLTQLNDCLRSGNWCNLDEQIDVAIEASMPYVESSGGYFDPGAGELVRLYGFHTSSYPIKTPPPGKEVLSQWRAKPASIRQLHFNHDRSQVRSENPNVRLDFNAIAEGLALQSAAQLLNRLQIENALINLGGDVAARGDNGGKAWLVGIREPRGGIFASVELHDGEYLFSSGAYTKYRRSGSGERWPHVLNPLTGAPASGAMASSVLSFDPLLADTAATALMAAGPEHFETLVESMGLRCAMLLSDKGRLQVTAPMLDRLNLKLKPEIERIAVTNPGSC